MTGIYYILNIGVSRRLFAISAVRHRNRSLTADIANRIYILIKLLYYHIEPTYYLYLIVGPTQTPQKLKDLGPILNTLVLQDRHLAY